jgi:transcriptional regulator with XRE-family HTH domain
MSWTLKALRENNKLTLKEVAAGLGLKTEVLQYYERDSSEIPIELGHRFATFYGIELDHIFLGKS